VNTTKGGKHENEFEGNAGDCFTARGLATRTAETAFAARVASATGAATAAKGSAQAMTHHTA